MSIKNKRREVSISEYHQAITEMINKANWHAQFVISCVDNLKTCTSNKTSIEYLDYIAKVLSEFIDNNNDSLLLMFKRANRK